MLFSVYFCNIRWRHYTSCKRGGWSSKTTVTASYFTDYFMFLTVFLLSLTDWFYTKVSLNTRLNKKVYIHIQVVIALCEMDTYFGPWEMRPFIKSQQHPVDWSEIRSVTLRRPDSHSTTDGFLFPRQPSA